MDRINGPADLLGTLEKIQADLEVVNSKPLMADHQASALNTLQTLITHLKEPGKGVNPVTMPGVNPQTGNKTGLSIMRVWLDVPAKSVDDGQQRAGVGVEPVYGEQRKDVTVVAWDGDPVKPNIISVVKIAEHDFVQALAQVFPLRELWVESGASKVNTDLLIKMLRGQS